ncbi:hypothetical protein K493DRAFT_346002 [Basidiobolus meristosporus CBS 931.73]|uniref:Uncharacterized protein n=1 Tax=Basidiobolus meristosporus CBS 931.73 TaxID=1314790 RepID=A0A1Y1Z1K0_9FUNG|nr:hypothetical protein K493DRAFT_346002 [Basidiobolus meristosporus CBS 931.73]|eukprot:ORY03715.1 hypothetical protein K493DRAFT_346002 [Basidiobolus meristosporus CBS 931.73]
MAYDYVVEVTIGFTAFMILLAIGITFRAVCCPVITKAWCRTLRRYIIPGLRQ